MQSCRPTLLLTNKDRETDSDFVDLVNHEDFLGSHVLKVGSNTGAEGANGNVRENRNKAKQYTTLNGRTVVVKEAFVYSNKGFRNLNQAQLLSDELYYRDGLESQQWLIYYISKPLIGTAEPIKVSIATLPPLRRESSLRKSIESSNSASSAIAAGKKNVKTFGDVLSSFPLIARQMQPGLQEVLRDFNRDLSKPLPSPARRSFPGTSRRRSSASSRSETVSTVLATATTNDRAKSPRDMSFTMYADDEEAHMRRTLESAVTSAIDLFQLVDKQQLSLLGATTEVTGPLVERMIERYIAEQVHDKVLFPRLCNIHKVEDRELDGRIHGMTDIDIAQVGIEIEGGRAGKIVLSSRLTRAVEEFRKLGVASSPQHMLEILLETQKILTASGSVEDQVGKTDNSEKPATMTVNADTLVSLLLVVVIRSQVRGLQARLAYMRSFIFIDDVDGGELGYALSTFEAVLLYLATDSGGLRVASRRNKKLWQAIREGNLEIMRKMLESESPDVDDGDFLSNRNGIDGRDVNHQSDSEAFSFSDRLSQISTLQPSYSSSSNLSHVFPFEAVDGVESDEPPRSKAKKRVSIDVKSLSGSSEYSFRSRTSTVNSRNSAVIEGDTSIEKLCQTQDSEGSSILMMAIEAKQPQALDYMLSLAEYFPLQTVLEDCSTDGTTLFSAAVQLAQDQVVNVLVDYLERSADLGTTRSYLYRKDTRGRSFAHYLFNAPQLIMHYGTLIPWRDRDSNGQTPLSALCRSYDHPQYNLMVNSALEYALQEQGDGEALHLDNHIDLKGNTILHAVSDPYLALRILQHCDTDPNAQNNKKFTPLMVASKYGRYDLVRAIFLDPRVDPQAKEHRGMTAVELAKDDEIRNRIDDMVLVNTTPASDGRATAIVRSFFVEDGTIRVVIKTATRSGAGDGMIAVTTCRRSLEDFEKLAKWLSVEHPASWLPSIFNFRSPFQIPSKPSRAVLQDIQIRLDKFVGIMLAHTTFANHELLWEFILVPEIQPEMMSERSLTKAELRKEKVQEDYNPIEDVRDVESFVGHARESIRGVNHSTKIVNRRVTAIRNITSDLVVALDLAQKRISTLAFLPETYAGAFARYVKVLQVAESDALKLFHQDFQAIQTSILAMLSSLSRPHALIDSLHNTQRQIDRHKGSLRRSDRWPLGLLDDTRKGIQTDAQERMHKSRSELRAIGCELSYTQQTVAAELAGWQDLHGKMARRAIGRLAKRTLVKEKDRLEGLKRALRAIRAPIMSGASSGAGN